MDKNVAIYGVYDTYGVIRYVGKTVDLRGRFKGHLKERNFNVVGIKVLEWVFENNWKEKEIYWINFFPKGQLENKQKGGNGAHWLSLEQRLKISIRMSLQKCSEETKRKISIANSGNKLSEDHKEALRLSKLGKSLSKEHKNKLLEGSRNKIFTENYRSKLKAAWTPTRREKKSKEMKMKWENFRRQKVVKEEGV